MKNVAVNVLVWLYNIKINWVRRQIERVIVRIDGGYFWSQGLRRIYKKHYGLDIGIGSYGCFDAGRFPKGTTIGNYCSIAAESRYLNGNHPMNFVTMHPMFCNKSLGFIDKDRIARKNLNIGHDVWIGYGTIICAGCENIGNGAIIGAGSVVTKDIEPYGIYAGTPARLIRYRFPEKVCMKLEETEWWNLNPKELLKYNELIDCPEKFIETFQKNSIG